MSDTPKWEDTQEITPTAAAPSGGVPHWDDTVPHESTKQDLITQLANKLRDTGMNIGESGHDLGLGAVSGATFGFPDELEGMGKAGVEAIAQGKAINPLNPEFMAKYRAYQQEANKKYKEADERSPYLYGAGNIVGGVATAPVMGAAGLATSGGRAAVKEALKEGGKMAAAKVAAIEAGKDALVGMPAGALYSLGNSEGKIETPEGRNLLLKDAEHGAAMGGLVGGTVGLASAVLPNVAEAASNSLKSKIDDMDGPFSRILKKSYKLGDEGVNLGDETVKGEYMAKPYSDAEDIISTFDKGDNFLGGEVSKVIKAAEDNGERVNIDQSVQEAADKIAKFVDTSRNLELDPKSREIIGRILTQNSTISPTEAQMLRKQLGVISQKYAGRQDVLMPVMDALQTVQSGLKEGMDNFITGYGDASRNFAQFRQMGPEQIIAGNKNPQTTGTYLGKLKNADGKFADTLTSLIKGATKEGAGAGDQAGTLFRLKQNLQKLEQSNPKAFAAMGKSADDIITDIKNASDTSAMIQGYHQQAPHEGINLQKAATGVSGTGKAMALKAANKIGLHGPKILDAAGTPLRLSKKIMFDLPLESVGAVADHLAGNSSPAIKNLGTALQKAVANKDAVGKNAVLFSIMQNPNTRKLLDLEDDQK